MTFTGVPVRASIDPAWAPNTSGMSSCDGGRPSRTAMTTTTGSRAATAPFTLMSAVSPATSSIIRTSSRVRLSPTRAMSSWPAQAVTPVASRPSLTTNRAAMKMTAGSPKPASAWSRSRTPVKYSASDAPMATIPTGMRFETNATTTASRIAKVIAMSAHGGARYGRRPAAGRSSLDGIARPERQPEDEPQDEQEDPGDRDDDRRTGSISAMIVPIPASFW